MDTTHTLETSLLQEGVIPLSIHTKGMYTYVWLSRMPKQWAKYRRAADKHGMLYAGWGHDLERGFFIKLQARVK